MTTFAWAQFTETLTCRVSLEFIDDSNFSNTAEVKQTAFNGLSGLVLNQGDDRFYIISDDRSQKNPARFYTARIEVDRHLKITTGDVIFLKNKSGVFFPENTVDFEGITMLDETRLLISSEGSERQGIDPGIAEFTRDGIWVRDWELPTGFLVEKRQRRGVRNNLGIEALTITPDKKYVFAANEQALKQDGEPATIEEGTAVRILKYNSQGELLRQYPYMVSPLPNPDQLHALGGHNGLVELLALDEYNLLTLERSWVPALNKVFVRIYHINLKNSQDISSVVSLKSEEVQFPLKTLVLDLDDIIPLLSPENKTLDNLEGMSFGPILKDGSRSVILVSDGNFNKHQRTLFLAFKLKS